jgi:hypothetical protein
MGKHIRRAMVRAALGAALAVLAASVTQGAAAAEGATDGIWRSRGYGLIAQIAGRDVSFYDVTAASCLRNRAPPWADYPLPERARLSADRRSLTVESPWGLTTLYYDRLPALPAQCRDAGRPSADPEYNFEVFWHSFAEHYAFFAERGVDWQAIRSTYRPRVTPATREAELLEIIESIFRQLQDRHVALIAGPIQLRAGVPAIVAQWYAAGKPRSIATSQDILRAKVAEYLAPAWRRHLDPGSLHQPSSNLAHGTAMAGRIGYLSIASESGYAHDGSAQASDRDAAQAALAEVFAGFGGKQGLIVDLRMNSGGSDEIGLDIAGWLADRDRPGFTKCARDGSSNTPAQHTMVRRQAGAFAGPTVVLVSQLTVSAGENLAMILRTFPHVIVVGDRTAGAHSDPLIKPLPNGWRLLLSNERFVSPDGTSYEGIGIPPDVLVAYEPEEVRVSGRDPLLDKALHLLGSEDFRAVAAAAKRPGGGGRPGRCL